MISPDLRHATAFVSSLNETDDIDSGLRPYRLRTRNWKPDDRYLREEAIELANSSRQKVLKHYKELH